MPRDNALTLFNALHKLERIVTAIAEYPHNRYRATLEFSFIPENGELAVGESYAQWKGLVRLHSSAEVVAYGFTLTSTTERLLMRLQHPHAYRELELDHLLHETEDPLIVFKAHTSTSSTIKDNLQNLEDVTYSLDVIHALEQSAQTDDPSRYMLEKLRLRFTPGLGGGGIPYREEGAYWQAINTISLDYGRTMQEATWRLLDRVRHPDAYPEPKHD